MNVQYVLLRKSQPIPANIDDLNQIKLESLHGSRPGLTEITIGPELNGASLSFGERTWELLRKQTPKLAELLNRDVKIIEICYSDRYLKSPLVLLLLHSFFKALTEFSGGISQSTELSVKTTLLKRESNILPRWFYHDWRDGEDRREVVNDWFTKDFSKFYWNEFHTHELPHERKLELVWSDGFHCKIILDQGFGFWRIVRNIRSEFPFENTVAQQINKLTSTNLLIEEGSQNHPTHWYYGSI